MVKFLVLALFYGDYPELARRCGQSLRALWNTGQVDLRIGLNEVSPRTQAVLDALLPGVERVACDPQIYKYPMMRRLLQAYDGDATHLMWFDDDSCLLPGVDARSWLQAVATRAEACEGSLGGLFHTEPTAALRAWVARQPWATGKPLPDRLPFNVGGWVVNPLALLRRCDWPPQEFGHNGGDVAFGALLHQQGLAPENFRAGIAINADETLADARAPRRGVTHPWPPPPEASR